MPAPSCLLVLLGVLATSGGTSVTVLPSSEVWEGATVELGCYTSLGTQVGQGRPDYTG